MMSLSAWWTRIICAFALSLVGSAALADPSDWVKCAPEMQAIESRLARLNHQAQSCIDTMRQQIPPGYLCRRGAEEDRQIAEAKNCADSLETWLTALQANPRSIIHSEAEKGQAVAFMSVARLFLEQLVATSENGATLELLAAAYTACSVQDEGFDPDDVIWLRCSSGVPMRLAEPDGEEIWETRFLEGKR